MKSWDGDLPPKGYKLSTRTSFVLDETYGEEVQLELLKEEENEDCIARSDTTDNRL